MTRGNRSCPIFVDDHDRIAFASLLTGVLEAQPVSCLAYCLMTTHYHLVLETRVGLSEAMHALNGRYARAFNRRHGYRGHLFERRFHSVPIETDWHLLELARYLVLNPVRADICRHPRAWRWSSYRAVLGLSGVPQFLDVSRFLGVFGRDQVKARAAFREFVEVGIADERRTSQKRHVPVPGTEYGQS
jgi:putative transposase